MTTPISGIHFGLSSGDYHATIASVGASLRTLEFRGRPLVVPFDADEVRPAFRGATLAPWPNRVIDGRYTFNGVEQQLALTEPARGHALHGLASWLDFTVVDRAGDAVTLSATVEAQAGYPHRVDIAVTFSLDEDGLHTTVTATNSGTDAAPWGTAPHPYLVAGEGRVDDWTLSLPATTVVTITEERLLPVASVAVDSPSAAGLGFVEARVIGDTFIDHAYTGLIRDAEGNATVSVLTADGTGVEMTWDGSCPWVQIHTADTDDPATNRIGLAVEPMTCPPDAFNSGEDLIVLEPGASSSAGWTIRAV
ncbi:aldose 1-epimerase family protein [Leifsonia sp. NPDC058230]|uniref:aldose 1-epimerase family protein n=1 Tax=Leifsonia sp. NPDC058230 TaxID=3346391 RepID=UPI0036DEA542